MWYRISNLYFLLMTSTLFRIIVGSCPTPCSCKWKGGKQTAECGGHKLRSIPEGIDVGIQVLNFSSNSLTVLQSERFQKMELVNLQKIYLSSNELIRIHDRAFRGLSNLVELDLSDNMLTSIPTETFQDYPSLMRLTLSNNPIKELKTSAFKYLSYLTTLELSNCQIAQIEDEAFIGMDNLEWLRLDGNRIRTIRGSHILPESLHGINLQGNRWNCDCKLMDVYSWLHTYNIPQSQEPKCFEPQKFQGQDIRSLQLDDLACLPDITPTTIYLEISEGRNISLTCKIAAVPEATISWWFQGQILQNDTIIAPNLHLYYYIEEGVDEKRSELFIFNANVDDNGTFACVAENSAGRVQANYTIRVIVKEEPVIEEVPSSQTVLFIIIGSTAFVCLLLFICCCIIICKCKRGSQNSNRKIKRSSKDKDVTSSQLQNSHQKCSSIANSSINPLLSAKLNGNLLAKDSSQQEMMLYLPDTDNLNVNNIQHQVQFCTGADRNPDLINDAESGKLRKGDNSNDGDNDCGGETGNDNSYSLVPILRPIPSRCNAMTTLPRGVNREMYQIDVHLNSSCFVDQNGYPIEYSLAPLPIVAAQQQAPVNYYKTLPHNRSAKLANNSTVRLSNEAEFITRTSQTFQTYAPDIPRYTAKGYPCTIDGGTTVLIDEQNFPSPPEGYKSDGNPLSLVNNQNYCQNSLSFQSQQQQQQQQQQLLQQQSQWPSCLPSVPGYHPQLVTVKCHSSPTQTPSNSTIVTKKCVSAQTNDFDKNVIHEQEEEEEEEEEDEGEEAEGSSSGNMGKCRQLKGPLADSPDEGYVGDVPEATDI